MVEVKKYSTAWKDNVGFTNPDNALNVCDVSCMFKAYAGEGSYTIQFYNYGFNIPADAVIDEVYWGFKALNGIYMGRPYLIFRFCPVGSSCQDIESRTVSSSPSSCETCVEKEAEWVLGTPTWTPASFNNEEFSTFIMLLVGSGAMTFRCDVDCMWIRVVYHVPVPPPPPAKPLINKPLTNPILINVPCVRIMKKRGISITWLNTALLKQPHLSKPMSNINEVYKPVPRTPNKQKFI